MDDERKDLNDSNEMTCDGSENTSNETTDGYDAAQQAQKADAKANDDMKLKEKIKKRSRKDTIVGFSIIIAAIAIILALAIFANFVLFPAIEKTVLADVLGKVLGSIENIAAIPGMIVVAIMLIVAIPIELFVNLFTKYETTDIGQYQKYLDKCRFSEEYMPDINDIGDYEGITITAKEKLNLFAVDSVALFVEYDDENYAKAVNYIENNYTFFDGTEGVNIEDTIAEINGFQFRMVNLKLDSPYTIKKILCVGKNDEDKTVAYAFIYDPDVDVFRSMQKRIPDNVYFPRKYR